MKTLSYIKSHKLIASVIAVALIATTGGVSYALVNNDAETKQEVAQATTSPEPNKEVAEETKEVDEVKDPVVTETPAPSQTPTPTTTPKPSEAPKPTNPYGLDSALGYVYDKREKAGKIVGAWAGATSWPSIARSQGIAVDNVPQANDVAIIGHSAYFVESVDNDTVTMTTRTGGKIDTITLSKTDSSFIRYRFIH